MFLTWHINSWGETWTGSLPRVQTFLRRLKSKNIKYCKIFNWHIFCLIYSEYWYYSELKYSLCYLFYWFCRHFYRPFWGTVYIYSHLALKLLHTVTLNTIENTMLQYLLPTLLQHQGYQTICNWLWGKYFWRLMCNKASFWLFHLYNVTKECKFYLIYFFHIFSKSVI